MVNLKNGWVPGEVPGRSECSIGSARDSLLQHTYGSSSYFVESNSKKRLKSKPKISHHWTCLLWGFKETTPPPSDGVVQGLNDILRSEWFSGIWVLQEAELAAAFQIT